MIEVTLYSRVDCHLCEQALADLEALQAEVPHRLEVVDVDRSPELRKKYGSEVPVVVIGPYQMKAPFDRQDLEITLKAARNRQEHIESIEALGQSPGLSRTWTRSDAFSYWFARHYMAVFNLFVLIYIGLPVLAPVLMRFGAQAPARLIYNAYGFACHQLGYRSFFLFGEQLAYPRAAAEVEGLIPFAQATGLGETNSAEDIIAARSFIGNERIGYKLALCERDVAIYGAILLFGVVYALSGMKIPGLHWALWILIGLGPIGLDGFSQLLSQPPFNLFDYRESTPILRAFTGALFGLTTAWFGYPLVESTMVDTRRVLETKLERVKKFGREQTPPQAAG